MAERKGVLLASGADLARFKGVSQSAVVHASKPGGPLHRAKMSPGRYNRAHPDCLAWLRNKRRRTDPVPTGSPEEASGAADVPTVTAAALAEETGLQLDQVTPYMRDDAREPPSPELVSAERLALLAGVTLRAVDEAIEDGALIAAVSDADNEWGWLDISTPAALEFFKAHPFVEDAGGDIDAPMDFLAAALLDDGTLLADHPLVAAFRARCVGMTKAKAPKRSSSKRRKAA